MKTRMNKLMLVPSIIGLTINSHAQLDSNLYNDTEFDTAFIVSKVLKWERNGFLYFQPNSILAADIFTTYKNQFVAGTSYGFELQRTTQHPFNPVSECFKYIETYQNVPIEAAEFYIQSVGDYATTANGKIVRGINQTIDTRETEGDVLAVFLGQYNHLEFAWNDLEMEDGIKLDLDDQTATYYPTGELIWALDTIPDSLGFLIPDDMYRLAYRFDIISLNPYEHKAYYVDAFSSVVFRVDDLIEYGWATTLHHGDRNIDTKKKLIGNNYFLQTEDNLRDIHTKEKGSANSWVLASNVKAKNDNWGTDHQHATTAHWLITESREYYWNTFAKHGLGTWGKQLRVWSGASVPTASYELTSSGKDYIRFSNTYTVVDVAGHEFTHGVIRHEISGKTTTNESKALEEGFCDIFGTMVETQIEGVAADWELGEDAVAKRSLIDPPSHSHPDTYKGTLWNSTLSGDALDHVNNGVFNKFFYLLADGDIHNGVRVYGIGKELAAKLVYLTMINHFATGSSFADVRSGMLAAAVSMGQIECTRINNEIRDAWAAVRVGSRSACANVSLEGLNRRNSNSVLLYPNPSTDQINLNFALSGEYEITIYDVIGKQMIETIQIKGKIAQINIDNLPQGQYYVQVLNSSFSETVKIVKH